jgi:membrane protein
MITWLTKRFWPRLYRAATKWQEDDGLTWAASLAYYGAFSFFPLVLVIIAGAGFVMRLSPTVRMHQQQLIIEPIRNQLSPALAEDVENVLAGVQTNAPISGPIGLATLVLGAIGIFMQLEAAFDRIWKVTVNGDQKRTLWSIARNVLFTRLRAFLMLLGVGVIVLATFGANMALSWMSRYTDQLPMGAFVLHLMQLGLSAFLNGLMFTLIYRVIPKRHVPWKQAIGGGLVAGIAWEIGRQLLAFLIVGKSYTAYGVIGSFIVLMLWFYYASVVLLFGASFVAVESVGARAAPCPPQSEG